MRRTRNFIIARRTSGTLSAYEVGARGLTGVMQFLRGRTVPIIPTAGRTRARLSGTYTFYPVRRFTEIPSPGSKYIFVEENYTHTAGTDTSLPPNAGYNNGIWSFWSGNSYTAWWDPLALWHNDRTNLGYADGHAEKLVWRDELTVKFAHDRWSVPSYDQPGNVDQEYMSRAYPCRR